METLPAARYKKSRQANEPKFEVREALFGVLGVDLSQIHGFGAYTVLKARGRMRHGHESVAHGQAFHVVAHVGTG